MSVQVQDPVHRIPVDRPASRRSTTAKKHEVLRLWCAGWPVEQIATVTATRDAVVQRWVESPDPRLAAGVELRHTEHTNALMWRWHRNNVTLAELINDLTATAPTRPIRSRRHRFQRPIHVPYSYEHRDELTSVVSQPFEAMPLGEPRPARRRKINRRDHKNET